MRCWLMSRFSACWMNWKASGLYSSNEVDGLTVSGVNTSSIMCSTWEGIRRGEVETVVRTRKWWFIHEDSFGNFPHFLALLWITFARSNDRTFKLWGGAFFTAGREKEKDQLSLQGEVGEGYKAAWQSAINYTPGRTSSLSWWAWSPPGLFHCDSIILRWNGLLKVEDLWRVPYRVLWPKEESFSDFRTTFSLGLFNFQVKSLNH